MTALSLALAFTSALAFAAFVLWLRSKNNPAAMSIATDAHRLAGAAHDRLADAFKVIDRLSTKFDATNSTVSDLAMKAGLTRKS